MRTARRSRLWPRNLSPMRAGRRRRRSQAITKRRAKLWTIPTCLAAGRLKHTVLLWRRNIARSPANRRGRLGRLRESKHCQGDPIPPSGPPVSCNASTSPCISAPKRVGRMIAFGRSWLPFLGARTAIHSEMIAQPRAGQATAIRRPTTRSSQLVVRSSKRIFRQTDC